MSESPAAVNVLSVVIPVFNERDTWRELLRRGEAVDMSGVGQQLILVDDGSTGGTRDQLRRFADEHAGEEAAPAAGRIRYKVVFHERNQGKGAALRTGFAAAEGDVVVIQDADLEYDPDDHPKLLAAIVKGQAPPPRNLKPRPLGWSGTRSS